MLTCVLCLFTLLAVNTAEKRDKYLSRGGSTYKILVELFKMNRERLCEDLRHKSSKGAVVYLQGKPKLVRNGDVEYIFRQESNFIWAFGVDDIPNVHGFIELDLTCKSILFVDPQGGGMWHRKMTTKKIKDKYGVDHVWKMRKLNKYLETLEGKTVYCINQHLSYFPKPPVNCTLFNYYAYYNYGCRLNAFPGISASGPNGAILHYGGGKRTMQDGDMVVQDMGAEYFGYATDITVSYPINGKFTEQQAKIYNAVLAAEKAAIAAARPGATLDNLTTVAKLTLADHLNEIGILRLPSNMRSSTKIDIASYFMPHVVSHTVGLDVHDVYEEGVVLEEGMYFAIEPGCYFNQIVIDKLLNRPDLMKYVVKEELDKYKGFGGVRIEDIFFFTGDGAEMFSEVPRTVEEIEEHMAHHRNLLGNTPIH